MDQPVKHPVGVRATIGIITEGDDRVFAAQVDEIAQRTQGVVTAMNVADGEMALQRESPITRSQRRVLLFQQLSKNRFDKLFVDAVLSRPEPNRLAIEGATLVHGRAP